MSDTDKAQIISYNIRHVISNIDFKLGVLKYCPKEQDNRSSVLEQRLSVVEKFYGNDNGVTLRNRVIERSTWFINRNDIDDDILKDTTFITLVYLKMIEDIFNESVQSMLLGSDNVFGPYSRILTREEENFNILCRVKTLDEIYMKPKNTVITSTMITLPKLGQVEFDLVLNFCHMELVRKKSLEKCLSELNKVIDVHNELEDGKVNEITKFLYKDKNV